MAVEEAADFFNCDVWHFPCRVLGRALVFHWQVRFPRSPPKTRPSPILSMKPVRFPLFPQRMINLATIVLAFGVFAGPVIAATIEKVDNTLDLNLSTSWTGGIIPGPADIAQWNGLAGANSTLLGGNLSLQGISIGTTGGAVTIQNGNTLTLGSSGINMSGATQNLIISSNLALATGNQVWNVATGRTLSVTGGTFTRSSGSTLVIDKSTGTGTVTASPTLINSVAPWAIVRSSGTASNNTAAGFNFATVIGGEMVAYTAATAVTTSYPANNSAINYDWSATGTQAQIGSSRSANTIRYTGTGVTQATNSTQTQTFNALMNAGTGTVTLGGGQTMNIQSGNGELILAAMTANIAINGPIINNGATAGAVTIMSGSGQSVALGGTSTFTGNLTINGTLTAGTGQGVNPSASNLGALQPAANRNIIVNSGGTLSLTGGNVLGTGGSTNTLSNTTLIVNAGGLFRTGLDGAGTGWWNKIGATNLNGGTIRVGSGANTGAFQGLALIGTVTVGGSSVSSIENFAASNSASNSIHLGQNATANQSITFDVADVTGSSASDLNVSAKMTNTSSTGTASGFTKTGAGTMTLSATNTFTGGTVISNGTLQIGNGTTDGSISTSSGITNNAALVYNLVGTQSYANAITGTGSLTKSGAGSLTLSGANNYSGNTTLNSGTLNLRGSVGAVSVADASTNVLGNATSATLNMSSLSFAGDSTLNLSLNSAPAFAVSGSLSTTPASGSVTLNASNVVWGIGTNSLINYGSFGGSISDFSVGTITGLTARQSISGLIDTGSAIALNVSGDLPVWAGTNGNAWSTAATGDNSGSNNWATLTGLSGTNFWTADTPEFNDTYNLGVGSVAVTNRAVDIQGADVSPGIVTFNNSAGDYTLSSSTSHGIVGTASLVKNGTSNLNISNQNTYTGSTNVNAGAVNLTGGLSGTAITVASGASLNVSSTGTISGAASLSTSGAVVLAGMNTYTGATNIGAGGSLQLGDGITDGSISSASISNSGSLVYNTTGTQSFSHVVTGSGTITKEGTGTLTLTSGSSSSTGGTSVNAGKLVANASFLNGGAISIDTGATLTFTGNNQVSTSTVTGGGSILNDTANTIVFTGDHSGFSGTFTHSAALNNTQFNTTNSGSADAAYNLSAGELIFAGTGSYTVPFGSLASTGGTIRGGNAAAGTTTLEVGNLDTDTTIAGNINNGGAKVIALTKVGNGTLTINGTNTYNGATTVSAGTLLINGALANTAVSVTAGTLGGSGSIVGTVSINGTLSPGNSIESLAIGSLTMASGSSYVFEVADNSSTGADLVAVNGTLSLTGVTLDFDAATLAAFASGSWLPGDKITLISYTGTGIDSGFTGYTDDTSYFFGANEWLFNYNDTIAGNNYNSEATGTSFITMTVVPEPGAALLGGIGLLALLRRRR
jgi:fibronectin-binding autotransporter adhesin